jgi:hypothetical protein
MFARLRSLLGSRWLWNTTLWLGYGAALWGSFEWACTLTEQGLIASPVWSGALGYPFPHHYIWGFVAAAASTIALELKRKHEWRREEEPDR